MAKRRVYTGSYHSTRARTITTQSKKNLNLFMKSIKRKIEFVCQLVMDYYLVFGTIFFVLVMSFVLPDFAHMLNTSKELKSIKKIVNMMSNEVTRAEAACLTAAEHMCYLQCSMRDDSTETEVTIMSYVYTNSFDALKTKNASCVNCL